MVMRHGAPVGMCTWLWSPLGHQQLLSSNGLYRIVGDYLKFIRMWLNDGVGDHGRVLEAETVRDAVRQHLPDHVEVTAFRSAIPTATNDGEFYPGIRKSWSLAFMINQEPTSTGRPAGSQGWAGLANLYYWIDRENGIGGFWATQVLPFIDPARCWGRGCRSAA